MKREKKTIDDIHESTKRMVLDRYIKGMNMDEIIGNVKWWEGVSDDNAKQLTQAVILESMKRGKR